MFWNPIKAMASLIEQIAANTRATVRNTEALDANTLALDQNSAISARTNLLLEKLLDRLRNLPDPGPISLTVTMEDGSMLQFKITLPPLPEDPGDIVSGLLKVTIGDGPEQSIETTKEQTEVAGLSGEQGQAVNATFAYVDDAGNLSEHPSVLENVILADSIPPASPGALGLTVTAEV